MSLVHRPYFSTFVDAVSFQLQREGISSNPDELAANMALKPEVSTRTRKLANSVLLPFAEHYVKSCRSRGPIEHSCHSISHGFAETLQQTDLADELPIAMTIGNVWFRNQNVYGVTRERIERTIVEGFDPDKTIDLHVWLTLSDMTVVDLSILSTLPALGLSASIPQDGSSVLIWREDQQSDFIYEPLLVDNQFFSKVERGIVVRSGA